ncbi:CYFA0S01e01970g1_1 [Cyberlindnera fabianii]|uniref:protein-tyrosine-phosphatase n=1 Tax=Cyberlindnera fabianii TaxID=36022 RepID=A0A061AP76_CYBFA|nr:CYFA0S01e01970g1_1 [Cyberlindnera fabianii]
MSNPDSSFGSFRTLSQSTSPQSKRNTKNLSLQLNKSNTVSASGFDSNTPHSTTTLRSAVRTPSTTVPMSPVPVPMPFTARSPRDPNFRVSSPAPFPSPSNAIHTPTSTQNTHQMFRHPSISRGTDGEQQQSQLQQQQQQQQQSSTSQNLQRRATLSLAIPTDNESSKSSGGSKLSSTNSIPSFSSSSPITSSPLVPATPNDSTGPFASSVSSDKRSSHSSTSTLRTFPHSVGPTGDVLKTQTLIRDLSSFQISDEGDQSKMNAYPNGPACVLPPNLFLYSEPKLDQLEKYDLVINVARELSPPLPNVKESPPSTLCISHYTYNNTTYYYVPWTHTSKLCPDLPFLTDVILENLSQNHRVLIHCQCGVSRSASVIVALFMKMHHINLNEAYNMLKERAPEISPNMSLIFQLMEWGELIGVNGRSDDEDDGRYDVQDHDGSKSGSDRT